MRTSRALNPTERASERTMMLGTESSAVHKQQYQQHTYVGSIPPTVQASKKT